MNNGLAAKINHSSMQVLKTLQVLLENNYTMTEIIEKLNLNEKEPVFNNSVVSKYINTCRYCGFEIPKIQNKYYITKMPFGLEFTPSEIDLIGLLQNAVKSLSSKTNEQFDNLIFKISRFSSKTYNQVIEKFLKAIETNRKVVLYFKNKSSTECLPLSIIEKRGKTFLNVLCKNKEHTIALSRLVGMELLHEKFFAKGINTDAIFKLTGGLAQRYTSRENEEVQTEFLPECLTVTNKGEDKKTLLHRLLRYDSCCEVTAPQTFRDEIKAEIDAMLANYGE